jgi:hypothetical protein
LLRNTCGLNADPANVDAAVGAETFDTAIELLLFGGLGVLVTWPLWRWLWRHRDKVLTVLIIYVA